MKAIFEREVSSYYNGIQGYLCGAFILLFAGIYTMGINLNSGFASFESVMGYMDFILIIVIPILSMRIISEDRKQKTDQLLYSLPMGMTKIVIGKYLAMLVVLAIPTIVICAYPYILSMYGELSLKTAYSSIAAYFFLSAALAAIGMFVSSFTENQGIAAGICFICMLVIYYGSTLANFIPGSALASFCVLAAIVVIFGFILNSLIKNTALSAGITAALELILAAMYLLFPSEFEGLFPEIVNELSVFDRFYIFTTGIFDATAFVYFLSIIGVFLFLTVQSLEKRRWN